MQVPKLLVAAVVFAVVLVSVGFFAGQLAKPATAQGGSKITGTIVLHESESNEYSGGAVSLPGSSCDVIVKQCNDGGFYNAGPLTFNDEVRGPYYIVPVLYRRQEVPIDFVAGTGTTVPTKFAANMHSVFGINRNARENNQVEPNTFTCDGIVYDDLDVTAESVFIVGQAYYASAFTNGQYRVAIEEPSYWGGSLMEGNDNAGIPLTSLVVAYSCTP